MFLFVSKLIESELKRLRLLTRRMTGKDLDGLTFAELLLLESLLKQVLLIVKKLKVRERIQTTIEEKLYLKSCLVFFL